MSVLAPGSSAAEPAVRPPLMTADEFIAMYPDGGAELVKGVVKELPMAFLRHGQLITFLFAELLLYLRDHDHWHLIGQDSMIRLGREPETVRGPDIALYSYEKMPKGPLPDRLVDVVPDLVFEVNSPSDRWTDIFSKVQEYLDAGVRAVVVLDNDTQTASVCRPPLNQDMLRATDTLTLPDVLPGFSLPLAKLFS